MDIDQIPGWLKALAASLWLAFVFAPPIVWLTHLFGDTATWATLPALAAAFWILRLRACEDDLPDAEYYRRKAQRANAQPNGTRIAADVPKVEGPCRKRTRANFRKTNALESRGAR